jgi:putative redox protein
MDGSPEFGGEDRGPKPKPLILSALAGCTGIDVVLILKKMKVEFSFFNIEVSAELSQAEPRIFEKIHLIYQFRKGEIADYEKVQKAVSLSQERYCGVSAMLRKAAEISYEIQYLD